jgi:hypothetical protein
MPSMREALESAIEEHNEPEQTENTIPASASEESAVASAPESSEPDGEVSAEKEGASAELAPEKAADPVDGAVKDKEQVKPETPAERLQHRVDRAPASWKKDAKGEWAALPLQVRQEVYKREMEVERVLKETAPIRQQIQEIQNVVSPYMARIQSAGVTPVQAMNELFKADFILATGTPQSKAQMLAKLVNDYGVSIEDLDRAIVANMQGQLQTQPQGFDPNYVNQLVQQQLNHALAPIYQERQQREQAVVQSANQTVEQMSLNPAYPYFDDVREEMADLIEVAARRGVALSLEDAYTKAVAINPDVSGQQSRQAMMTQANQQHQQAQKARNAASSVSGAPASGGANAFAGDGSLRSSIEAAFNNARV